MKRSIPIVMAGLMMGLYLWHSGISKVGILTHTKSQVPSRVQSKASENSGAKMDRLPAYSPSSSPSVNTPKWKKSSFKTNPDKSATPEGMTYRSDLPELRGGLLILTNVKAVNPKNYSVSLGEILAKQMGHYFVKVSESTESDQLPNVVYDERNNRFHPIGPVLKIINVDALLREDLKSQGLMEYHYVSSLKTLYVQSSHAGLLETYKNLLNKGLPVSLEIIKAVPQKR